MSFWRVGAWWRRAAVLLTVAGILSGASLLEQHVDEILRTSRAIAPGIIGINVVQLATGKVLYSRNPDKLFTPASNAKLFSTALALTRLGPAHKLTTRVLADSAPDVDGRVAGDLVLYGGGDPSMSQYTVPYDAEAKGVDPLLAIDSFADRIVARGVREVHGDVVGDDTAWPYEPYPPGWSEDDTIWDYGAPVSALMLNSGMLRIVIRPGATEGDPAALSITPAIEYFAISNRIRTALSGEQKIRVERIAGTRELRLSGTILRKTPALAEEVAVDDPALFAAKALYDALVRRGVTIHGQPVARHREVGDTAVPPSGFLLAERHSQPLIELLRVTDKVSQNLWAEMLLRETARVRAGDGSRRKALDEMKVFLAEIGISGDRIHIEDGSGLSRLSLVSPEAIVRLLRSMNAGPRRDQWKAMLPVGALDGSLKKRFAQNVAANAILAKTGSLSGVAALSGYTESATFGELAFSIIVNHTNAPTAEIRSTVDKIALALLE